MRKSLLFFALMVTMIAWIAGASMSVWADECDHDYEIVKGREFNDTQHQMVCNDCGDVTYAEHAFEYVQKDDGNVHYVTCECEYGYGYKEGYENPVNIKTEEHVYNAGYRDLGTEHTASCVCGAPAPGAQPHDYTARYEDIGQGEHKAFCECGVYQVQKHTVTLETVNGEYHNEVCQFCRSTNGQKHQLTYEMESDTHHKESCAQCGYTASKVHTCSDWEKVDEKTHRRDCVCGFEETGEHAFSTEIFPTDDVHHETRCACGAAELYEHDFSDRYVQADGAQHQAFCACGVYAMRGHDYSLEYTKINAFYHRVSCVCGASTQERHNLSGYYEFVDEKHHRAFCSCGGDSELQYHDGAWQTVDGDQHNKVCNACETGYAHAAHSWEVIQQLDPTCEHTGSRQSACSVCGAEKTEVLEKLTHAFPDAWSKNDASTHQKTCACGKTEYADHVWNHGEAKITEATHTRKGKVVLTCSACGETRTEELAKLEAHTYGEWTANGDLHSRKCACGKISEGEHRYGEWTLTQAATDTEEGKREKVCEDCGATLTETIPALAPKTKMGVAEVIGLTLSFAILAGSCGYYILSPQWKETNGSSKAKKIVDDEDSDESEED